MITEGLLVDIDDGPEINVVSNVQTTDSPQQHVPATGHAWGNGLVNSSEDLIQAIESTLDALSLKNKSTPKRALHSSDLENYRSEDRLDNGRPHYDPNSLSTRRHSKPERRGRYDLTREEMIEKLVNLNYMPSLSPHKKHKPTKNPRSNELDISRMRTPTWRKRVYIHPDELAMERKVGSHENELTKSNYSQEPNKGPESMEHGLEKAKPNDKSHENTTSKSHTNQTSHLPLELAETAPAPALSVTQTTAGGMTKTDATSSSSSTNTSSSSPCSSSLIHEPECATSTTTTTTTTIQTGTSQTTTQAVKGSTPQNFSAPRGPRGMGRQFARGDGRGTTARTATPTHWDRNSHQSYPSHAHSFFPHAKGATQIQKSNFFQPSSNTSYKGYSRDRFKREEILRSQAPQRAWPQHPKSSRSIPSTVASAHLASVPTNSIAKSVTSATSTSSASSPMTFTPASSPAAIAAVAASDLNSLLPPDSPSLLPALPSSSGAIEPETKNPVNHPLTSSVSSPQFPTLPSTNTLSPTSLQYEDDLISMCESNDDLMSNGIILLHSVEPATSLMDMAPSDNVQPVVYENTVPLLIDFDHDAAPATLPPALMEVTPAPVVTLRPLASLEDLVGLAIS